MINFAFNWQFNKYEKELQTRIFLDWLQFSENGHRS